MSAAIIDAEDGAVWASTTDFGPRIYLMEVAQEAAAAACEALTQHCVAELGSTDNVSVAAVIFPGLLRQLRKLVA